ncbi:MAG TPA: type II secretion system F family protein [Candidatus Paceibacterota bacterium]
MKKSASALREEANVLRLLYLLVSKKIPFLEALPLAANTFTAFKNPLLKILADIKDAGYDVRESFLGQKEYFSPFTADILGDGTNAGAVDEALRKAVIILDMRARLTETDCDETVINSITFFHMLASLLHIGIPLLSALTTAGKVYLPTNVTDDIFNVVCHGGMLTDGFRKYPQHFTPIDCSFMEIGEMCGSMPDMSMNLAIIKERLLLRRATKPSLPTPDVGALDIMVEYKHLATLVNVGLPLMRSFTIMSETTPSPRRQTVFKTLNKKVENGATLSEAMESIPTDFPGYIVELIHRAERSGDVDGTLTAIADHLQWELLGIEPADTPVLV